MKNTFVNRKTELATLEKLWDQKSAQFVVIYGRRRVGKTVLLDHFAKRHSLLHWIAYRSTGFELLRSFSQELYLYLNSGEHPPPDFSYGSWQVAFETLALHATKRHLGVIIDEFPYLAEADSSFPSLLQALWDKKLSPTSLFFALSGSRIGMIKEQILAPRGPLYGRSTALLHLEAIPITTLTEFFPHFSPIALVESYAITGGIPKYFELIDPKQPVLKSVEAALAEQTTFLTSEPEFLLHEEFREPRIPVTILRALGEGPLEAKAIAARCGLDGKILSRYLDQLIDLRLVERRIPAGQDPQRSRKGRYGIRDHFLNFYFRFVAPFLPDIEKHLLHQITDRLHQQFDAYVGTVVFEWLCQDWLAYQADQRHLTFVPTSIGGYWNREIQVDLLGISPRDQAMIVGECKWTQQKVGKEILHALREKAKKLAAKNDYHYQLFLFSRSGFTEAVMEEAAKKQYRLVSLKELFTR